MMTTLSVVVPTYNEKGNLEAFAQAVGEELRGVEYELIFVDDSTDGSEKLLGELAKRDARVKYLHRQTRGLGSAVVAGFGLAQGEAIGVMDADFQHPVAMLSRMLRAVQEADLVIGSRFLQAGGDKGLSGRRKVLSWLARRAGQVLIKELRGVTDPTGGLFMCRSSVVKGVDLPVRGWKVLMEVLVRGKYQRVVELPYEFVERREGHSKLTSQEGVDYLVHLIGLARASKCKQRAAQGVSMKSNLALEVVAMAILPAVLVFSLGAGVLAQIEWKLKARGNGN